MPLPLPVRPSPALLALLTLACAAPNRRVDDAGPLEDVRAEAPPDTALQWPECRLGERRCHTSIFQTCVAEAELLRADNRDCAAEGLVCDQARACVACHPGELRCTEDNLATERCADDGSGWRPGAMCDTSRGEACRSGRCGVVGAA